MVRTEVWLVCNVGVCVLVGDMLGASCIRFGASTYFLCLSFCLIFYNIIFISHNDCFVNILSERKIVIKLSL